MKNFTTCLILLLSFTSFGQSSSDYSNPVYKRNYLSIGFLPNAFTLGYTKRIKPQLGLQLNFLKANRYGFLSSDYIDRELSYKQITFQVKLTSKATRRGQIYMSPGIGIDWWSGYYSISKFDYSTNTYKESSKLTSEAGGCYGASFGYDYHVGTSVILSINNYLFYTFDTEGIYGLNFGFSYKF